MRITNSHQQYRNFFFFKRVSNFKNVKLRCSWDPLENWRSSVQLMRLEKRQAKVSSINNPKRLHPLDWGTYSMQNGPLTNPTAQILSSWQEPSIGPLSFFFFFPQQKPAHRIRRPNLSTPNPLSHPIGPSLSPSEPFIHHLTVQIKSTTPNGTSCARLAPVPASI